MVYDLYLFVQIARSRAGYNSLCQHRWKVEKKKTKKKKGKELNEMKNNETMMY